MAHQPHDALVKAALSRQENAIGAIKAALPADLLAQLDLSTLRLSQDSFVGERLGKLFSDLVYEVQVGGRPGLVCFVLYEHQSTVDPLMAARLVIYLGQVWDAWMQDHKDATRIPPVIPVVLYHGPRAWSAPTSLLDVIDLPEVTLAIMREYLPSLRFLVDDLSLTSDASIRAREGAVFSRLMFLLLKHARSLVARRTGPGSLEAFLRSVADLLDLLPDRGDRIRSVSYIIEVVDGADPATIIDAMGGTATREFKEDVMTAAEKLRQEGKLVGLLEGKRQGLVEGALQGQRRVLLRQLGAKFGALKPEAEARVAAANEATLEAWAEAVLTAGRLDDVWAATPR